MDAPAAEFDCSRLRRLARLAGARAGERALLSLRDDRHRRVLLVAIAGAQLLAAEPRRGEPGTLLSPPLIALLLVANLIPAIALMVLLSRRVGDGAGRSRAGSAAGGCTPGWSPCSRSSPRCRRCWSRSSPRCCSRAGSNSGSPTARAGCSRIPSQVARIDLHARGRAGRPAKRVTMSGDLAGYLQRDRRSTTRASPRPSAATRCSTATCPKRSSSPYGADERHPHAGAGQSLRPRRSTRSSRRDKIARAAGQGERRDQLAATAIGALTRLDYGPDTYLYAARVFDPQFQRADRPRQRRAQRLSRAARRGRGPTSCASTPRLLLGALIIVGLAIFTALKLADRLVRPVGELVDAAGGSRRATFPPGCRSPTPRTRSRRWRPPSTG